MNVSVFERVQVLKVLSNLGKPVGLLICVHGRPTQIHLKFNLKMTMISI